VRSLAGIGVRARGRTRTRAGHVPDVVFLSNGGVMNYEMLHRAPEGGLVEAGTPECRGPAQLVLYQRAQEEMLRQALVPANMILLHAGHHGDLDLLKNCRDAQGHLYGAQENYEVEVASGVKLFLLRAGILALLPLHVVVALLFWALFVVVLGGVVLGLLLLFLLGLVGIVIPPLGRAVQRLLDPAPPAGRGHRPRWTRPLQVIDQLLAAVLLTPLGLLARAFALGRVRRATTAFFASRPILTGAGTVEPDGCYVLSEKGPGIRKILRTSGAPGARGIFELPDLLKAPGGLLTWRPRLYLRPLRRRQRLQVGLSDSNMAEVAEYLKVGTALLVLDMTEAGLLDDAPALADPIAALHAIVRDPTLRTRVRLADGTGRTALELQRFYLERAKAFVQASEVVAMEATQIVGLWERALDALQTDPGLLVGRLDWVTKRFLIEKAGADAEHAAQKKIDLRYHELAGGWARALEAEGVMTPVVSPAEVARAMQVPPEDTPALARGRLVAELADSDTTVDIDWDRVRIGRPLSGKVVHLADFRRR
jgi:proteasome accessory factor A